MPVPPYSARRRGPTGVASRRPRGVIARSLRAIVATPFQADPAAVLSRTPSQRLHDRHVALLRLILICLVLVAALVVLPAAIVAHASSWLLAAVATDLLLSLVCLVLDQLGHPTAAALTFILGAVAVGLSYAHVNPPALPHDEGVVVLIYVTMSLLILLAGTVLPPVFVWIVAGLVIAVTVTDLPSRHVTGGRGTLPTLTVVALVVAVQTLLAVMSWVAAQTAAAGVNAANQALDQMRELTALKDQFLIDANHELRAPIMAWYGNTELLTQFGARATAEQQQRMLERALASGDAVIRLLNSVLDAGALGTGAPRMRLSEVAVEPLVREVLATFDPREIAEPGLEDLSYGARHVTIAIEPGLTVLADAVRLRQIFINLLTNALKYSPPRTPLTISGAMLPAPRISRWRMPVGRLSAPPVPRRLGRLSVRDYGLGVPPRDATKLFNRFVRLERDIAGPVRGTGVGLFLCRVLAEAMGGHVWVESSGVEGEGSTFSVALPLASAVPPQALTAAHAVVNGPRYPTSE